MKTQIILLTLGLGFNTLSAALTTAEEAALQFMREEEKLARDVYLTLYAEHGARQFSNVARSEQTHTDRVRELMLQYEVADLSATEPGVFNIPELQALHDALVAQGRASLAAAYQVGVLIEETDIADLEAHMAQTDNPDLLQVFTSLRNGSLNHLAAFSRGLATTAGFPDAEYADGWHRTWMGWLRLGAFPWVQDAQGQWRFHAQNDPADGRLFANNGQWFWTTEGLYPWCYALDAAQWQLAPTD